MKKKGFFRLLAAWFLCFTLVLSVSGSGELRPADTPAFQRCTLSSWSLLVDGEPFDCQMYNVDGYNYFKLRDLAMVLRDTPCRFSVDWDEERQLVTASSGKTYVPVGGEGSRGEDRSDSCVPSRHAAMFNGQVSSAFCYNIGDNNYFKLRDLAAVFGYAVDYDPELFLALIYTSPPEPEEEPDDRPEPDDRDGSPEPNDRDGEPEHGGWDDETEPGGRDDETEPDDWDGYPEPDDRDDETEPNGRDDETEPDDWDDSPAPYARDDGPEPGEASGVYTVIFQDRDGALLKTEVVPAGACASPPSPPDNADDPFLGWEGSYTNVTGDSTVRAVYQDEENVFCLSSERVAGDTFTVLLRLDGRVVTCGFDLSLLYDRDLELVSFDDNLDLEIILNDRAYADGIKLNYSGTKNVTKQRDIAELTFRIRSPEKTVFPLEIQVNSIYRIEVSDPVRVDYHTLAAAILTD